MFFMVSEFSLLHEIAKHFHVRSSYNVLKSTCVFLLEALRNRIFSRSAAVKIALTVLKYSGKMVDTICNHWFYLPCLFFILWCSNCCWSSHFFVCGMENLVSFDLLIVSEFLKYLSDTHVIHFSKAYEICHSLRYKVKL